LLALLNFLESCVFLSVSADGNCVALRGPSQVLADFFIQFSGYVKQQTDQHLSLLNSDVCARLTGFFGLGAAGRGFLRPRFSLFSPSEFQAQRDIFRAPHPHPNSATVLVNRGSLFRLLPHLARPSGNTSLSPRVYGHFAALIFSDWSH